MRIVLGFILLLSTNLHAQNILHKIHGKVFNNDTQQPIESVMVLIQGNDKTVSTITNDDGNYDF